MNLHLREIDGILYLYAKTNDEREYSDNLKSDLNDITSYLKTAGFQIVYHNDNVILKNADKGVSLVIYDYKHALKYPVCANLNNMIMYHRQKYGAINKLDRISKKKTHKSKHAKRFITKVGTFLIAGAIVAGIGVYAFGDNNKVKNEDISAQEQIYLTEISVPEAPLHIKDIGESLEEFKVEDVEIIEVEEIKEVDNATLEYENLSDTEKAIECKNNYFDLIKMHSVKLGIDPNIMLGVATQERGVHSREIDDGGGVGLMQVQYSVHVGETLHYKELDDNGEFVSKSVTVTDNMVRDLEGNIKLGCIIMQNCLNWTNYNIPMAIQMYNQGYGAIHDLLVSNFNNKDEVVSSPMDLSWYRYTDGYAGDAKYLEHVLQWCGDTNFKVTDARDGSLKEFTFNSSLENVR